MKRSIRTRLFVSLSLISCLFLLLFGTLYTTFYDKFVVHSRQQQLLEAYSDLQTNYSGNPAADLTTLQDAEMQYSIRMLISDPDGVVKYNSLLRARRSLSGFFSGGSVSVFSMIDQLPRAFGNDVFFNVDREIESIDAILFTAGESSVGVHFIGLLGVHPCGDLLLLQMPSPVISTANQQTGFFLIFAGGVSLLATLLVAYFFSRRLTRPILEIQEVAEHMAGLDFSSRYRGPQEDEIGRLGGSINLLSDQLEETISRLQETNARLEDEIAKARRLDEMRMNLLINVSHELKTPLALVRGYAEGLRLNLNSDPESRDFYCSVIEDEARHMTQMVGELLSVSRIEAGTTPPQLEVFSLDELLDELCGRLSQVLADRSLTLRRAPSGACLLADRDMIGQAVGNYLSNAVDHTPEGGEIRIETAAASPERLRLSVINQGSHIPEEELPRIWQSFYKLDHAHTRAFGGTGIGLSIVKAVIEAHHCRYGARNLEEGVEFWCELPLSESPADSEQAPRKEALSPVFPGSGEQTQA